jgi:hypothetical protein
LSRLWWHDMRQGNIDTDIGHPSSIDRASRIPIGSSSILGRSNTKKLRRIKSFFLTYLLTRPSDSALQHLRLVLQHFVVDLAFFQLLDFAI